MVVELGVKKKESHTPIDSLGVWENQFQFLFWEKKVNRKGNVSEERRKNERRKKLLESQTSTILYYSMKREKRR